MKKTYWWRILVVLFNVLVFIGSDFLIRLSVDKHQFANSPYGELVNLYSILLFIIIPFLYFVNDFIFLRWLYFSIIWFLITVVLFSLASEEEIVAIIMSSLFLILSFTRISWDLWKKNKLNTKTLNEKRDLNKTKWLVIIMIVVTILFFALIYVINTTMLNGIM